jgi:SNF2 family DNA or RNA helicase
MYAATSLAEARESENRFKQYGMPEEESFEDFLDDQAPEMSNLVTSKVSNYPAFVAYEHQATDFERYKDATEIALFWEQGLGKSKEMLDIAKYKYKKGEIDALLIIAPNGVHKQWAREQIPIWLQDTERDVQIIGGRGGKKQGRRFKQNVLQVVCTNIDTFSTPTKWTEIVEWANNMKTMIVLDEATVIKNISSKRTERLLYEFNEVRRKGTRIISSRVRSAVRAILTGTPVTNGPFDAWALFEFLRPNYFNRNYYSFRAHYGMFWQMVVENSGRARAIEILINPEIWARIKQIIVFAEAHSLFGVTEATFNYIHSQEKYDGPFKNVDELKKLMEPVASFRTIEECVDMPGQLYTRRLLEMGDDQKRVYKDMETQLLAEYQNKIVDAKSKLTAYIRLQQIASGFICTIPEFGLIGDEDEEVWEPNTKEITWIGTTNPKLDAILADVEACPTPSIVITHFSAEAERLFNELSKIKRCCLQTGWKKVGTIEQFQAGEYDCLVANVRCISRGFNLQVSHRMFFYSNTFSLEDRLQVESRIYRIGQATKCEYVDYIMLDTIDMKTVAALRQKKSLLDYVRGTTVTEMLTEVDDIFKQEYSEIDFSIS